MPSAPHSSRTGKSVTAQIGENPSYEGSDATMCSEPLNSYFELAGIEPGFQASCTALWRGYVGSWECSLPIACQP